METYEPHYIGGLLQNINRREAIGHPLQPFFTNDSARFENLAVPMGLYHKTHIEQQPLMECDGHIDTVGNDEYDKLLNTVVIVVRNNKQVSKKRNPPINKRNSKKKNNPH